MKTSEMVTALIAAYGAIVATVSIGWQMISNRAKVKVTVQRNMQTFGDPRYDGKTLTVMTVTNVSRRAVTIVSMGAIGLYPHNNFVVKETRPPLACELTEGKFITCMLPQADLDFSKIDYWTASDSHGRQHKQREASRFRHWKSVYQLGRSFRKKKT